MVALPVEPPATWPSSSLLRRRSVSFASESFDAMAARIEAKQAIEAALAAWTAEQEGRELERRLAEAGVPASLVQRPTELLADPHLAERGFFVTMEHSELGPVPFDGLMTRFSAKRRMLHKAAPCVGEDTERVLREVLALSDDEIAEYAASGVFS